jgi:hypothetical protein
MEAATIARENATLREEFLRRGLATTDDLDRIGWVSHTELDLWEQAGVLDLALTGLQEVDWTEVLHPRGRGGKWIDKLGGAFADAKLRSHEVVPQNRIAKAVHSGPRLKTIQRPPTERMPGEIKVLKGRRAGVRGGKFPVFATPEPHPAGKAVQTGGTLPEAMSLRQFKQEATDAQKVHLAGRQRLERLATQERKAGNAAAKRGDHAAAAEHFAKEQAHTNAIHDRKQTLAHGQSALYERRTKSLEKRIGRRVRRVGLSRSTPAAGQVRGEHDLSQAEVHFNDAGRVSQKTLLAYAEDATTRPTTAEMYRNPDGTWDQSRAKLHARIIDMMLREHNLDAKGNDRGLSKTNSYLKAPSGKPTVMFTGGGYAAGKGGLLHMLSQKHPDDPDALPQNALLLDPDLIKAELPEFQASSADDPEANLRVYAEAWDIAQHVMAEAQKRKLNVIVDGITNTNADEVAKRVKSFTDAGYVNPRISYVSTPTNDAISRAKDRAEKARANAEAGGRMIPDVIMRAVHRDVSATIPGVMDKAAQMGARVHVYDTNQGLDEASGRPNPPRLVAQALPDGKISFPSGAEDKKLDGSDYAIPADRAYAQVLAKAHEQLPGVRDVAGPKRGVWKTGGQTTRTNPEVERRVGRNVSKEFQSMRDQFGITGDGEKKKQPVSDPQELLARGESKTLPALQQILDIGTGVIDQLGGTKHDISQGKSFQQTGQDIQHNMDQPHLIVAPIKSLKRAIAKQASLGHANDFSDLHDAVRATVTVPTAQDLEHTLATIRQQVAAKGWTVERMKRRLVDANGSNRSTENGYGDTTLILRAPESAGGLTTELQVNTNPLWWTKEIGPGHHYYELERQVEELAKQQKREPTPAEKQVVADLQKAAKPYYDRAWGVSQHGGLVADPHEVILGTRDEQRAAARELKGLTARTNAILAGTQEPTGNRARRGNRLTGVLRPRVA